MPVPEVLKLPSPSGGKSAAYSYDFKQEFSGWPVLTVSGAAGSVVRMTPAELNDWKDGRANATGAGAIPHQNFGPAYWQYTLGPNGTQQIQTYRPRFFTYGYRYLLVEIMAPGASGTPPAPAPAPLPEGDAFVRCSDKKNALCQGGKIFFLSAKTHTRHHVPKCETCPGTAINTCSPVTTVSATALAAAKTGPEFACSMLGPPPPPGPSPTPAAGHVTGPGNVTIHSITGEFVYTSAKIVGNFTCSDEALNRIHSMIVPAMKSNLQGRPVLTIAIGYDGKPVLRLALATGC